MSTGFLCSHLQAADPMERFPKYASIVEAAEPPVIYNDYLNNLAR